MCGRLKYFAMSKRIQKHVINLVLENLVVGVITHKILSAHYIPCAHEIKSRDRHVMYSTVIMLIYWRTMNLNIDLLN